MPTSRYNRFKTVKSFVGDPRRLETFPAISENEMSTIPHTIIRFKESDRLDHLAQTYLGSGTYWWAICLLNDLDNPFSYKLLPGFLLKIPNSIDPFLNIIRRNKATS